MSGRALFPIEMSGMEGGERAGEGTYPPQAAGALCLVDVHEVGHHAALEQTALCLHADLRRGEEICIIH